MAVALLFILILFECKCLLAGGLECPRHLWPCCFNHFMLLERELTAPSFFSFGGSTSAAASGLGVRSSATTLALALRSCCPCRGRSSFDFETLLGSCCQTVARSCAGSGCCLPWHRGCVTPEASCRSVSVRSAASCSRLANFTETTCCLIRLVCRPLGTAASSLCGRCPGDGACRPWAPGRGDGGRRS